MASSSGFRTSARAAAPEGPDLLGLLDPSFLLSNPFKGVTAEGLKGFATEGWPVQMVQDLWAGATMPGKILSGEKQLPAPGSGVNPWADPEMTQALAGFMDLASPSALMRPASAAVGMNLPFLGGKKPTTATDEAFKQVPFFTGDAVKDEKIAALLEKYPTWDDTGKIGMAEWNSIHDTAQDIFPGATTPTALVYSLVEQGPQSYMYQTWLKNQGLDLAAGLDKALSAKTLEDALPHVDLAGAQQTLGLTNQDMNFLKHYYTGPPEETFGMMAEVDNLAKQKGFSDINHMLASFPSGGGGNYSGLGSSVWLSGKPSFDPELKALLGEMADNPTWKRVLRERPELLEEGGREAARLAGGYTMEAFRGTGKPSQRQLRTQYGGDVPEWYFTLDPDAALNYGPNLAAYWTDPRSVTQVDYPAALRALDKSPVDFGDLRHFMKGQGQQSAEQWSGAEFDRINKLAQGAGKTGVHYSGVRDVGGAYDQLVMFDDTKFKNRLAAAFDPTSNDTLWQGGLPVGLLEGLMGDERPRMTKKQWEEYLAAGGA